jgi:hypothetical protein
VTRKALLLIVSLGALREPCGTEEGSQLGPNAPCTRSSDCAKDLSCIGGVCSPGDGGAGDAGLDANDAGAVDGTATD